MLGNKQTNDQQHFVSLSSLSFPRMADPPLFSIPSELVEAALVWCHPITVSSFSQTCSAARTLVYKSGGHLWRQLYLAYPFDDPRTGPHVSDTTPMMDWMTELKIRVQAELVLTDMEDVEGSRAQLELALDTLVKTVASSGAYSIYSSKSKDLNWVTKLVTQSDILSLQQDDTLGNFIAQLRSYYALSLEKEGDASRLNAIRLKSRCFVYNLSHYWSKNQWSVYRTDGTINWKHVEHVINVIQMNLDDVSVDASTRPPVGLEATRACSIPHYWTRRVPEDWAGVEGVWRRYVCFMDYRLVLSTHLPQ